MAGKSRTVTRASRRVVLPAINSGDLRPSHDGRYNYSHRLLKQIGAICNTANKKMPPFSMNTAPLDRWLQSQLLEEKTGFLTAFIDQAAMIQSNLHYRIIGPRSLVGRTLGILNRSEGGEGFRKLIKMTALNFYCSNFGGAVYLDRAAPVQPAYLADIDKWYWSTPPVESMFATDPTLFEPNSDYVYPFTYDGTPWTRYDFFRIVSMPSTELRTWNIGRCPLFRCIQIARMTSATYEHIFNNLSPDSAKGIVTIKGMTADEFLDAISGSEAVNEEDANFREGFTQGTELGDLLVLADRDEEIVVKFVTMSRLPDGFFVDQWVRWTLQSFSISLGFPLDEFLGSTSSKLLGQSGAEVEQNAQRATTKGGNEFIANFQDYLQTLVVPQTVYFTFSERDSAAELDAISKQERQIAMVVKLFEATQLAIINKNDENIDSLIESRAEGEHIINRDEARRMLVEMEAVPAWMADRPLSGNDVIVDDTIKDLSQMRLRHLREEVRDLPHVQRLAAEPTGEPVVLFDSFVERASGFQRERQIVLWDDDGDLNRPTAWAGVDTAREIQHRSGPTDWQQRGKVEAMTSEKVIELDFTKDIARVLRRYFVEYARSGDLSPEGYKPMSERVTVDDGKAVTARMYAIMQIARDNVVGKRKKIADTAMAEMASAMVQYASGRWDALLGKEKPPHPTSLATTIDEDVLSRVALIVQMGTLTTAEGEVVEVSVAVEKELRQLSSSIAKREALLAFRTGMLIASDVTDLPIPDFD